MKLLFVYQARVILTECNYPAREFSYGGHKFVVFENRNVYFNQEKNRLAYTEFEGESFFINVEGDVYTYVRQLGFQFEFKSIQEHFCFWFDRLDENTLNELLVRSANAMNNPAQYEAEQAAAIVAYQESAKRRDAERAREREEKAAREVVELKAKVDEAREKFRNGVFIDYLLFEELCKENGIVIPIRTVGWARENCQSVGKRGYSIHNYGTRSKAIMGVSRELAQKLG